MLVFLVNCTCLQLYIIQELLAFNLPDLALRFFQKTNRNLRFQTRIQYFKNEPTQINLLKNSFNNLDLNVKFEVGDNK